MQQEHVRSLEVHVHCAEPHCVRARKLLANYQPFVFYSFYNTKCVAIDIFQCIVYLMVGQCIFHGWSVL